MARQRGVGMSVDVTPDAQLISHENGLYVLLRNLLDNALRYTPEGGEVRLSIRRRETSLGDGLIMEVMDTGPGIPLRERQRVRERFVRLAGQNTSGSGLGLSIVDELAERLGAELTLDDSPLGSAASPGLSARLHFG